MMISYHHEYIKTAVRYSFNSKMISIFRYLNSGPDFSVYLEKDIILISFFCVLRIGFSLVG